MPDRVFRELAEVPAESKRITIARHEECPLSVLERLAEDERPAEDESVYVREEVDRNGKTPPAVLRKLAGDPHEVVRKSLVARPDAPLDVLAFLASDDHQTVRMEAAKHSKVPETALKRLARDESASVRQHAREELFQRRPVAMLMAQLLSPASRLAALLSSHRSSSTEDDAA